MLIYDTIKEYIDRYSDSHVVLEGLHSTGKTTLARELMKDFYYYKSIGVTTWHQPQVNPEVLSLYKVIDRFIPFNQFMYDIDWNDSNLVNYCLNYVDEFISKYLNSNTLFVFMLNDRFLDLSLANRVRGADIVSDNLKYLPIYLKIIEYMSPKYDILVSTKETAWISLKS